MKRYDFTPTGMEEDLEISMLLAIKRLRRKR